MGFKEVICMADKTPEINELYSVQLVMPVRIGGKPHMAARYSMGTGSLTVPAETAISYEHGTEYIEKLAVNHEMGLIKAQGRVLRSGRHIPLSDIEPLSDMPPGEREFLPEPYTEPHGEAEGTVFHIMTHVPYFTRKPLSGEDFRDHVKFLPFGELERCMEGKEEETIRRDLYMPVNGSVYRINYGITSTFRQLRRKAPELFDDI